MLIMFTTKSANNAKKMLTKLGFSNYEVGKEDKNVDGLLQISGEKPDISTKSYKLKNYLDNTSDVLHQCSSLKHSFSFTQFVW